MDTCAPAASAFSFRPKRATFPPPARGFITMKARCAAATGVPGRCGSVTTVVRAARAIATDPTATRPPVCEATSIATVAAIAKEFTGEEVTLPLPRIEYHDAMERFGNDRPDLRYGLELKDVADLAAFLRDLG